MQNTKCVPKIRTGTELFLVATLVSSDIRSTMIPKSKRTITIVPYSVRNFAEDKMKGSYYDYGTNCTEFNHNSHSKTNHNVTRRNICLKLI